MTDPNRPSAMARNKLRDTSTLVFEGTRHAEFYVRGAVCWPMEVGDRSEGFAVIGAQNVETGIVYLFEPESVYCIEHLMGEDGSIRHLGACAWFGLAWQAYGCGVFFVSDADRSGQQNALLEILRSPLVAPKPRFVEIHLGDDAAARRALWEMLGQQRAVYAANGPVHQALREVQSRPGAPLGPVALGCAALFAGLSRYPWPRARVERSEFSA